MPGWDRADNIGLVWFCGLIGLVFVLSFAEGNFTKRGKFPAWVWAAGFGAWTLAALLWYWTGA
jgi:hypothetical protein